MNVRICTKIKLLPATQILQCFDLQLFKALQPPFPFPKVKILRFDGCNTNDQVHLELNFLVFKSVWVSEIVQHWITQNNCFFIDKGTKLPFFLSYWQHKHIIETKPDAGYSCIIDDIEFKSWFGLSFLLWPMLYVQFAARKSVYQKIFGKPDYLSSQKYFTY